MKPQVILHMGSSIDGRIVATRWSKDVAARLNDVYDNIHRDLKVDGWLVGQVTMAAFGKGDPNRMTATKPIPRTTWQAPGAEQGPYAIALIIRLNCT